jgi:hypothetical protein
MRFLHELAVFTAILCIAFAIVFVVAWAVGSPLGLDGRRAALLAGVFLCFWLPAFANVHIGVTGGRGESSRDRVCAAIRAFGMLVCSAVLTARLVAPGLGLWYCVPMLIGGCVLSWGTLFFENKKHA